MFIEALCTIVKLWKQSRCPTINKWIEKMWHLYTMEFYSATKKNEILSFASKWMELVIITLNQVTLTQKTKNLMFSSSYANYEPKTNAVILLDTSHTNGIPCTGGIGQGKETKT
jgi:hypothetical protein